jgi:hypothetical protein
MANIRVRPWSTVQRVDGDRWIKQCGPGTRFEAGLNELLGRLVPERVLVPLEVDAEAGRLVLPDGGPSLGEQLPKEQWLDAMLAALPVYAELQRTLEPHVGELLAVGVDDMRPSVLPGRFEQALEVAPHPQIAALRPEIAAWSAQLAQSPGAASLDHNDLHPFNLLAGGRFFDWGDAVVAHPFACMLVPLRMFPGASLRSAYLEVFDDLGSRAELEETLELAVRLAPIARTLVWRRALGDPPDARWASAPREMLETLLN